MDISARQGKVATRPVAAPGRSAAKSNKANKPAAAPARLLGPRDKWSFWTHFAGIVFGIAITIYFVFSRLMPAIGSTAGAAGAAGTASGAVGAAGAAAGAGILQAVSFVIFGLSTIALYTGSSVYHYYNGPADILVRLRKMDHSMIYVMIAGSYTPVLANCLPMPKGAIFLAIMWAVAFAGIIIKVFWLDAPRWLYTSMYILMGWAIMVDPHALTLMAPQCLALIAAGGVAYTIGAVIYILKKPNITEEFGFHEIFHCFILLGTALQFVGIAFYI